MMNRIAVIDLDPVIHIVANVQWYAGNHTDKQAAMDHAEQFVNTVRKSCRSSHILMFFQDVGHTNYRNDILAGYKGHRVPSEGAKMFKECICLKLAEMGAYPLKQIESDDALSILVNKYIKKKQDYLIVENDKDLAMLPGDHYNPFKKQPKNKPPVERWYSYTDQEALFAFWCQVITGDSTDMPAEFCGMEGIGPAKATKMLINTLPAVYPFAVVKEYTNKYGMSNGLRRMVVTYDMIKLLRRPLDHIPETQLVYDLEPVPFKDNVEELFDTPDNPDPSASLI